MEIQVGNKREDGNRELLVDGAVHPRFYFGIYEGEEDEGLQLLGADDDEEATLDFCFAAAEALVKAGAEGIR